MEIVLKRFSEDGSVDELRLEGDLLDARNLALQLSSEGNCVYVEASESESEEATEEVVEEPGTEANAEPDSP